MTPHPFGLTGTHVLITGAGGGIGRALVAAFHGAGALVTGADRDMAHLTDLPLHHRLAFDLTDATACAAAVAELESMGALPSVLVNNAGASRADTLDKVDAAAWANEIDTNLTGVFNLTKPVVDAMVRANGGDAGGGSGGVVVFVSSVNALGHYGNPAYSAAKAGLVAYARALALERGDQGVRSNVVCPGSVRTPAWDHRDPQVMRRLVSHYAIGRLVEPKDVANAALFLASPLAAGITGAVLPVDGGLTAGNLHFVRDIMESVQ